MASVVAADIGYGGVKAAFSDEDGGSSREIFFNSLVSMGAPVMSHDVEPRDTVITVIDGVRYEAGKDAHLAVRHNEGRFESPSYSASPQYRALVAAALHYSGFKDVDVLVLGLPNSTYAVAKDELAKAMTGEHRFIRYNSDHEERVVTVRVNEVRVVRQPVGGLVDACFSDDPRLADVADSDSHTLTIDPGFFTLDFLVSQGLRPIEQRSGALNRAGASAIYRAVQNALQIKLGADVDISRIERAFSEEKEFFKVNGEKYYISAFQSEIESAVRSALLNMSAKVQSYEDIDTILVVGGAARVFAPIIASHIKRRDVIVAGKSVFANVRGFLILGQDYAKRHLAA